MLTDCQGKLLGSSIDQRTGETLLKFLYLSVAMNLRIPCCKDALKCPEGLFIGMPQECRSFAEVTDSNRNGKTGCLDKMCQ